MLLLRCDDIGEYAERQFTAARLQPLVYYTDHSFEHATRVWNYCRAISRLIVPPLTETEKDILRAAAYLHDAALFVDAIRAREWIRRYLKGKPPPPEDERGLSKLVREKHHILACEWIKDLQPPAWDPLVLSEITAALGDVYRPHVARCVRAHRYAPDDCMRDLLEGEEYRNYPETDGTCEDESRFIRMRLLGALLRLGDELDVSYKKAPLGDLQIKGLPDSDISQQFWQLHWHVKLVTVSDDGCVSIHPQTREEEPGNHEVDLVNRICQYHYQKIEFEFSRLVEMRIEGLPKLNSIAERSMMKPYAGSITIPPLSNPKRLEVFLDQQAEEIERKYFAHRKRDEIDRVRRWMGDLSLDYQELLRKLNDLPANTPVSYSTIMRRLDRVGDPTEVVGFLDAMAEGKVWSRRAEHLWLWTEQQLRISREAATSLRQHAALR